MNYCIILIILLSFSIILRFLLIKLTLGKNKILGDASIHYKIIQLFKGNKKKKLHINNFLIPGSFFYPVLFHFYSSFFSNTTLKKKQYFPNLFIYIFFLIIFFAYSYYLFFKYTYQPLILSIYTLLFFVFSTGNLIFRGPAIAFINLSERLLGKLVTSFFILSLFGYLQFNDLFSLIISIIFSALIFLSSKFAIQAIAFFCIISSILLMSLMPMFIMILGLTLSMVLSKGYSFTTFKNTFLYSNIYRKYNLKSKFVQKHLNTFLDLKYLIKNLKLKNFNKSIKTILNSEPARSILYYSEIFIILPLLIYLTSFDMFNNSFSLIIIISCLTPYLLTSFKFLSFLGESYRYIEYYFSFLGPVTIVYFSYLYKIDITFILLVYLINNIFISSLLNFRDFKLKKNQNKIDIIDNIINKANISSKDIIFTVSMRLGADIAARTNCKTFWWQSGGLVNINHYLYFIESYPFLSTKNWLQICKKYSVTKIVVDNKVLRESGLIYNFHNFSIITSNIHFTVYKFKKI